MKRLLALLMATLMLFAIVACDEEPYDTDNTNGENNDSNTENGDGAEQNTTHTHEYSAQVTKDVSCTADGEKTFTCSCGDSYTEVITSNGHSWGSWSTVSDTLVGRVGSEKRVCSTCSEEETRENTDGAIINSFLDRSLAYVSWTGENIHCSSLLHYFSHNYEGRTEETERFLADTVFNYLSERFEITEDMKEEMKNYYYDASSDTFELAYTGEAANFSLLGYVHNGDNSYTLYYDYESFELDENGNPRTYEIWKIDVQYNLLDSKPNKYLAFDKVDATPDGMIACEVVY